MKYLYLIAVTFCQIILAQQIIVKGIVFDEADQKPLAFVTVTCPSTTEIIGTQTDFDGSFELALPKGNQTLVFTYVGYEIAEQSFDIQESTSSALQVALSKSTTLLSTIVVTSSKFGKPISEVTVSMEIIKPSLIESNNDTELDQTIQKIPGCDVIDGQVNIRGGSGYSYGAGSRVAVLRDGLPILTGDSGLPNWDFVPLENVGQVEIIKGASSALYGSSAMNGIINIISNYPTSKPVTKVSSFIGFYDVPKDNEVIAKDEAGNPTDTLYKAWWKGELPITSGMSFSHAKKYDQLDVTAGAYLFQEDSWRQTEYSRRARANLNLAYRPKHNERIKFGLNTNIMVNRSASFLIWNYNDDPSSATYDPVGAYKLWTSTPQINNDGFKISLDPYIHYTSKDHATHKFNSRFFRNNNVTDTDQSTLSNLYYTEYQYHKPFPSIGFNLVAGANYSFVYSDAELFDGENTYNSTNAALFVQIEKKFFDKLNVSLGVRYEANTIEDYAEEKPVIRAGANYQAASATFIRASFGQAYRFPTIAERYISTSLGSLNSAIGPIDIGIYPNPKLLSETGWSAEIGVKQGLNIGTWHGYADAAIFINEYDNMMEFTFGLSPAAIALLPLLSPDWELDESPFVTPNQTDIAVGFQSLNIGGTQIKGFDFSLVGEGKMLGFNTTFIGGFTVIDPQFKDFNTQQQQLSSSSENILKYRFNTTVKADCEVDFKYFRLGVNYQYYSFMEAIDEAFNQFLPGVEQFRAIHNKGTNIFSGRIGTSLSEKMNISFIVKNLLNEEYALRPALIDAPRFYSLKLDFTL